MNNDLGIHLIEGALLIMSKNKIIYTGLSKALKLQKKTPKLLKIELCL